LIAIEVLSPEDRRSRIEARMSNLRDFGVPNLWVVDPQTRSGWDLSDGNWVSKERFEVADSPIYLSLTELFQRIDEDSAD
jgi:Uma2 family endonuclease